MHACTQIASPLQNALQRRSKGSRKAIAFAAELCRRYWDDESAIAVPSRRVSKTTERVKAA